MSRGKTLLVVCGDPRYKLRGDELYEYYQYVSAMLANDTAALEGDKWALVPHGPYRTIVLGAAGFFDGFYADVHPHLYELIFEAGVRHIHFEDHMGVGSTPGCAAYGYRDRMQSAGQHERRTDADFSEAIYPDTAERKDHIEGLRQAQLACETYLQSHPELTDQVTFTTSLFEHDPVGQGEAQIIDTSYFLSVLQLADGRCLRAA